MTIQPCRQAERPSGAVSSRLAFLAALAVLTSTCAYAERGVETTEPVTPASAVPFSAAGAPPPTAAPADVPASLATPPTPPATRPASASETPPSSASPATTPAPRATTKPPAPGFASSVAKIDDDVTARLSASWRPGCPVPLSNLRLVTITHWGYDGRARQGEVVVHTDYAEKIRGVFAALFEAGFPIDQVRLVDEFGADDDRSMAANNSSGFNCRRVRGSGRWSEHAYGRAVDINPIQNPYLARGGAVLPPGGREFIRRAAATPGLITPDGAVVAAFAGIGWRWGGAWPNPDYQHFSATGR